MIALRDVARASFCADIGSFLRAVSAVMIADDGGRTGHGPTGSLAVATSNAILAEENWSCSLSEVSTDKCSIGIGNLVENVGYTKE